MRDVSLQYFETLHGQIEGDAVHSKICSALSRARDMYVPAELIPILKFAGAKQLYMLFQCNIMTFGTIKNFLLTGVF